MAFARRIATLALMFALVPAVAVAHPLGNFTINHLTKVDVQSEDIGVRYVLDMAEIPSFQIVRSITPEAKLSTAQLAAWGQTQAQAILPDLVLRVDGKRVPLTLDSTRAQARPGAGGLVTLYLVVTAHAAGSGIQHSVALEDKTFAGRIGWHDVIAASGADPTHELTAYPAAGLQSPPDVRSIVVERGASGAFAAVRGPKASEIVQPVMTAGAARSNQLSDMLARGTRDPIVVLLTLLAAIALGALHALEPGHGKTLLAVTLVGARSTVGQAAILAGSLTFAHTAAVLALGLAINAFKGYLVPETIYPWITLISGAVIAVIGARAIARQLQAYGLLAHPHDREHAHEHHHDGAHAHDHPHVHTHVGNAVHGHDHGHMSDEEHARSHAIPGNEPMRFGPTVWAAMSGGIAPCPAALVVLLAAISLNQTLYGIIVIVAFSFGLAGTLTGIGIAVVKSAGLLKRHSAFAGVTKYAPIGSATIMAAIGCVLLGQGFGERGVDVSPYLVTMLAGLAIAGYAVTQVFGHRHAEAA